MAVAQQRSRREKRNSRRRWVWVALLGVLVAGGSWYIWQRRQPATPQLSYETVSVTPANYELTVSGPGTLEAAQSVSVGTRVAGTLETLVSVGDEVAEGQTLAQLQTTDLEQALTEAQLALEQAQAERESLASNQSDSFNILADQLSSAQRDADEAERGVVSAQNELTLAARLLDVGSGSANEVQVAQDAYDTAVAALTSAEEALTTLTTSQTLQGDANTQELRNAELAVARAELALRQAREDLSSATLKAPIAGVVTSISDEEMGAGSESTAAIAIQPGTTLSEGQTLLTLSNYRTVNLIAQIDETQIGKIAVGQRADVAVDALGEETFAGEVTAVSPSAELQDNIPVFEVTVAIANPGLTLRPGMTAEANIATETVQNTLTLPSAAVQVQGETSLIELEQDGNVVPVPVEILGSDGLSSIVRVAERPGLPLGGAAQLSAPPADAPSRSVAMPNPGELLRSGAPVAVRVPSARASSGEGDEGFAGPPRGGFGGPPPGGRR